MERLNDLLKLNFELKEKLSNLFEIPKDSINIKIKSYMKFGDILRYGCNFNRCRQEFIINEIAIVSLPIQNDLVTFNKLESLKIENIRLLSFEINDEILILKFLIGTRIISVDTICE